MTAAGCPGSERGPFCSLRQGERARPGEVGHGAGEKHRDRQRRAAEAGIYHVDAGSPSPPAARPRNALPQSYFLIRDALSDFRASLLLCVVCARRNFSAFRRLHCRVSPSEAGVDALRRVCSVKEICLWLCEKQHWASCSDFIGCSSGSGKPRARAVILASEGKKIEKDVWSHRTVHNISWGENNFLVTPNRTRLG